MIISKILRLERLVVEVETSFRGYLLAGQKTFLEPLQSAEAQLTSITDRLMMLTAGDQRLQGGIGLLHARVTEFVASKNRLTTIAENGQRDQVDLYVKVGDGRALFLAIDKAFKDFESRVDHEIPLEESDHEVWSWRTGWQLLLLDTAVLTCFSVARAFFPVNSLCLLTDCSRDGRAPCLQQSMSDLAATTGGYKGSERGGATSMGLDGKGDC
ncbi:MAG: CHASE3 domain-containing protein [Nitrospiraceae bacterium]